MLAILKCLFFPSNCLVLKRYSLKISLGKISILSSKKKIPTLIASGFKCAEVDLYCF